MGNPYNRTMRPGGESDMRVPVHKRKDSYGRPVIGNVQNIPADSSDKFADDVDAGVPYLDKGHRDSARMHANSIRGHDDATKRAIAEINRRLSERDRKGGK